MDRMEAEALWRRHNDDEGLWRHALAVEAVMRHLAILRGGDQEAWGVAGLLHDIDFQRWPTEHCRKCRELLASGGAEEWLIRAVESHGWGLCNEVEPESDMEKCLYAVDELTGFVTACALVRPSRSLDDLESPSVLKKWKSPAFAAGVNRSVIETGAERLGLPLKELMALTIEGMRPIGERLGLRRLASGTAIG